ncbi:RNA-binding S4 domain-containing protein [Thalassotalea sp. 1_MG-2023]|uniref:RNA-binding S4 domain-containing protein n=1 Tax=Thalassotalea sp. 1_MG-2023 TaxID=3062680 RepID=UPI0026E252A4|nr:RNA-binding S4 domain-containing protein [Thalassotalea sp. 1_MG-2023]MDO6428471.1 RNA-binding S4 domain-containing protein [Thalassotalea sp. 1_MG-2023]
MAIEIEVSSQPIELYKLLKIANLVSGGGEAKIVITEGYVYLNGEPEFQKRKKIFHQDIVQFNGEEIQLICFQAPSLPQKKKKRVSESSTSKQPNSIQIKGGRKKISL